MLRLFVTGMTPRSTRAIRAVRSLCEQRLKDRFELEIVDVYQQPQLIQGEQVFATPTLIKYQPGAAAPDHRRHDGHAPRCVSASGCRARSRMNVDDMDVEELRQRLLEAEGNLHAIYSGEIDALLLADEKGERRVFTLQAAPTRPTARWSSACRKARPRSPRRRNRLLQPALRRPGEAAARAGVRRLHRHLPADAPRARSCAPCWTTARAAT